MERKVIVIVGPTCSGKTELSLLLAEELNTEIISADSRQFYKYLDIGTAKPDVDSLKKIKHHFINSLNPGEYYNASKFEKDALEVCENLFKQNKFPIIVGGSGLYIKALIDGIFDSADIDTDYRKIILNQKELYGNEYIYNELKKVDPVSASKMLPQNWKRVLRALEVYHQTGEPIWKQQQKHKREQEMNFYQYGLSWERKKLYANIENRVDKMISDGLIEEVKDILNTGYDSKLNSLNTVGYNEIISYLNEEITLERAVELIKRNTRRYAKRQLTWFKGDERIKWFEVENKEKLKGISKKILEDIT
ncbi:MAG: tRNA (adenosine(37)-N6)-dimethylallyltransferase MiaA [Ignavibacteriaceae bacterium]